jgi:serine/threonine protein kinase/Flp pilus assembly protein TadD
MSLSDPSGTLDTNVTDVRSARFEAAWLNRKADQPPPRWQDYLPGDGEPSSANLVYLLLQMDIECRVKAGLSALLTELYFQHPRLQRADAHLDSERQRELIRWEYQQRWQNGQRALRADYQAAFPEHAEALSDLKPCSICPRCRQTIVLEETAVTLHCPVCASVSPQSTLATEDGSAGEQTPGLDLRGYELLERLGGGGMGDVYRAADPALGRDLAVKVIKADFQRYPTAERRFLREARVTGSLQHPGIVPIHNLGRLADGRLHYTMRLVRGRTLADILKEQAGQLEHLPELLAIFEKVCQAVAYAHSKRVIHRDLKPANVMVGRFGEVQVMDWGLAKLLPAEDQWAQAETAEVGLTRIHTEGPDRPVEQTRLGREMGTPAYMPPEQALGEWDMVDERADVFALGAILCEILTGQPLYSGEVEEALRKAKRGDCSEALARLDGCGADVALLSLCRECLAWEREGRPRDAEVVAQRVAAYQAEVQQRLRLAEVERAKAQVKAREERKRRRWMLTAVLLLLGGVAVSAWQAVRATTAEKKAWDNEGQAVADRNRAVQAEEETKRSVAETKAALEAETKARKRTREALNTLTDEVMEELLGKQVVLSEKEKAFLRKVLGFYEEFAAELGETEESRAMAAEGQFRVAKLHRFLGESAKAEAGQRATIRLSEKLIADYPDVPQYRRGLANSYNHLGIVLVGLGKHKEAEAAYRQALAVQEKLVADFPNVAQYRQDLALSHNNLAHLLEHRGEHTEAEAAYRRAIVLQERLTYEHPGMPDYRQDLALSYSNLGNLLDNRGRYVEAETAHRQALALRKKSVDEFPTEPRYREDLAASHNNLGILLASLGKGVEARAACRQAIALIKKLARDFPAVPTYRQNLATSQYNLGNLLGEQGKSMEAEAAYREAIALQERMTEDFPAVPAYRHELSRSYSSLGNLLRDLGRAGESETVCRKTIALGEQLTRDFPAIPEYRRHLAYSHHNLGTLLADQGKSAEAEAVYRHAIALREKLTHEFPSVPPYRRELASSQNNLGVLLKSLGKGIEAEQACRQAIALLEKLARDFPGAPIYRQELAGSYGNIGNLLRDRGQPQAALDWYGKAIPLLQSILAQEARVIVAQQFLRDAHWNRARALVQLDRHAEAAHDWQRAAELDDGRGRSFFRLQHSAALAHTGEHRAAIKTVEEVLASSDPKGKTPPSGPLLYDAACVYALSAAAVKDDAKLREQYAVRALDLLRQAKTAGFFKDPKQIEHFKKDSDLNALRQRDDYKTFAAELATEGKPR